MSANRVPDSEKVIAIIRETAAKEIMPRFNALKKSDISEKGPGDMVTTADFAAERRLESNLQLLEPGSISVGEEAVAAKPQILEHLKGSAPVWILDPLDGTTNFIRGKSCFATIVAYCVEGVTLAGWIYDPISDATAWAIKGEKAWMTDGARAGKRPLRVSENADIARLTGSLNKGRQRILERRREGGEKGLPKGVRYGCVGREYMDISSGELDFCRYARFLKPWDHAAGVLIHQEAGGYSAIVTDGAPYAPEKGGTYTDTSLILAPDREIWDYLNNLMA